MVCVKVPASSANLGSGFDSLGIALNLYNYIEIEESEQPFIYSLDNTFTPKSENNLVYRSAKMLYEVCGKTVKSFKIGQKNPIPMSRGLGSSSACIAAGLFGANVLLNNPLSREDLLNLAFKMEGHPDNVSAAILGGFTVSAAEGEKVYSVSHKVSENVSFVAFVPNYKLQTSASRMALPELVPHKSAVYNLSRAALLTAAFCDGQYDLLEVATKDLLHQQYRLPLIDGGSEVMNMAKKCGARACFISGSGPTIMAVVTQEHHMFCDKVKNELLQNEKTAIFNTLALKPCNKGVHIINDK